MSRTITALFDTRQDAEDGKARLKLANCDVSNVHIHDQSSLNATASEDTGMWSAARNATVPHDDRHAYEEGVRRGGFLLTADVDDDQVEGAIRALEDIRSVDFDQRQDEWRKSGWTGVAGTGAAAGAAASVPTSRGSTEGVVDEQRIPIAEEHLVVGKREVERGGARVRSYVRETPVHEQVQLHEEHVEVERRPVGEALSRDALRDGDAFKDRDITVTATGEEAVVAKEAVVTEEVVLRKTVEDHVERIDDTVRRTEVDIDGEDRLNDDRRDRPDRV